VRFFREAKAAASLKHPHVVTIHQVGEDRGAPFLAMEFLEGEALDERLKREGRLPVPEVLRIGREIAAGLEAAHERGLVHRDIKPGNVWLEGRMSHVKILDFGLARAISDQTHLTQSGAIVGTPAYMAPSRAVGKQADHRCDLFSLGCVLYRLATGQMPFKGGDTLSILAALALENPTPPAELLPAVPGPLSDLIMQLLAKDPARRPPSARAVADRLQRIGQQLDTPPVPLESTACLPAPADLAPAPAGASQAPRPLPVTRPPTGRRPVMIAAALGALALLVAAIYFLQTPKGTVRIEIDDDSIEAVLNKGGAVIRGADKAHDIRVAAGEQGLKIKRGDLEFETDKFILRKGDMVTLKVELLPGKIQVVQGDKVIGEHALPIQTAGDPDRDAAEWVLSIGGTVSVNHQEARLKAAADLPRGPFRLTAVDLHGNKQATDAGLAHFRGCKDVTWLNLPGTRVTDAGLAYFKDCKSLQQLDVSIPGVTDAGLANFKDCHGLTWVLLIGTQVSDVGLAHLRDCKDLAEVNLTNTRVTDAGLAYFKDWKRLKSIGLSGTQVTDAGMATFKGRTDLTNISLGNTKVTDVGLENFKNCKGLTFLALEGPRVTDACLAHFKGCHGLRHLWLNFTQVSDRGLEYFRECKGVITLSLRNTQVSDAGLELLAGWTNLESADLATPKVTEAGVKKLAAALPRCKIEWGGGTIEPTGRRDPDREAAEWVLSIGGAVGVNGQDSPLKAAGGLPRGPCRLTSVLLHENKRVTDAGLAHLKGCKNVTWLTLHSTSVGDAGLVYFKDCKNLGALYLGGTRVTDAGLVYFKECKDLGILQLPGTKVGDAGLANFKDCKNLYQILLDNTQVTDAGLAYFRGCKNMQALNLVNTNVSDMGLANFKGCQGLTHLWLKGARVTDAGLAHFKNCHDLTYVWLDSTQIDDTGLELLAGWTKLQHVNVNRTKVTEAGVKKLAAALSRCKIEWDGGTIEPTGRLDPSGRTGG